MTDKTVPASDRDVRHGDNELITTERLALQTFKLETRLQELERKAQAAKPVFTDEAAEPLIELLSDMDKHGATIEMTREATKEPYETALRLTNGHFFAMHSPRKGSTPGRLQVAKSTVSSLVLDHMQRKENAERERLDQIARKAREEEQAALEIARKERERQEKAAAEERARAAANAGQRASVAEANAERADARAFEAEQQAAAKPAEVARVRTEGGSLASTRVTWDFEVIDIAALKGQQLWAYVPAGARKAALAAFIKANAPQTIRDDQTYDPFPGQVRMIRKRALQVRS